MTHLLHNGHIILLKSVGSGRYLEVRNYQLDGNGTPNDPSAHWRVHQNGAQYGFESVTQSGNWLRISKFRQTICKGKTRHGFDRQNPKHAWFNVISHGGNNVSLRSVRFPACHVGIFENGSVKHQAGVGKYGQFLIESAPGAPAPSSGTITANLPGGISISFGSTPSHSASYPPPAASPAYPPAYHPAPSAYPPNVSYPSGSGAYPPPAYPPPAGAYPPPAYPPPAGAYPPPAGAYPPPAYPPPAGAYPPPAYPPPAGAYPPPAYPPPAGAYPPPSGYPAPYPYH